MKTINILNISFLFLLISNISYGQIISQYIETNSGTVPKGIEIWNNTSWTEIANMSTGRNYLSGVGTTTASLAFGGTVSTPAVSAATEEWTGAGAPVGAWATANPMNTGRNGLAGAGSYTSAVAFGGFKGPSSGYANETETYNGTAFTEVFTKYISGSKVDIENGL